MSIIQASGELANLFRNEYCNIGNGSVVIELRTCDVKMLPTMTIDNAARLAAKTIYSAMRPESPSSDEPEWLNKVTFASEEWEQTPAIKVVDNLVWYNSPPFVKSKKNLKFWELFARYWYIMVVQSMKRALVGRKDRTTTEDNIIHIYGGKEI